MLVSVRTGISGLPFLGSIWNPLLVFLSSTSMPLASLSCSLSAFSFPPRRLTFVVSMSDEFIAEIVTFSPVAPILPKAMSALLMSPLIAIRRKERFGSIFDVFISGPTSTLNPSMLTSIVSAGIKIFTSLPFM